MTLLLTRRRPGPRFYSTEEFGIYLNYVRKLGFEETPDYDFLRELFTKVLKTLGEAEDGVYDWNLLNGGKGWEASVINHRERERERRAEERERRHRESAAQAAAAQNAASASPSQSQSPLQAQAQAQAQTQGKLQSPRRNERSRTPPATLALNGAPHQAGSNMALREGAGAGVGAGAGAGAGNSSTPLPDISAEEGGVSTGVAGGAGASAGAADTRQRRASQPPQRYHKPAEQQDAAHAASRTGKNTFLKILTCGCA